MAGKELQTAPSRGSARVRYFRKEGASTLSLPAEGDCGLDLKALSPVTLFPGEQKIVPTGVVLEIPKGSVGLVKDRSSMAMRQIYTHAGVIDSSFRGAISILLQNSGQTPYHIEAGDRIAQLVILKTLTYNLKEVDHEGRLAPSKRGDKAFGSTGK